MKNDREENNNNLWFYGGLIICLFFNAKLVIAMLFSFCTLILFFLTKTEERLDVELNKNLEDMGDDIMLYIFIFVLSTIIMFNLSMFVRFKILCSSYYKVVLFIDPLQGLYAILLEILWIVCILLPLDRFRKATTTVSLYIC